MPNLTTYVLALIPLAAAGVLIWLYLRSQKTTAAPQGEKKSVYQGVVKKDWVVTGRIDFATQDSESPADADRPAEFKLLVEERRIVESIAGNENLEIQWRLASLREAKVVIAQYHKYLAEHGLIKMVAEEQAAGAAHPAPVVHPAPVAAVAPAMAAPIAPIAPAAVAAPVTAMPPTPAEPVPPVEPTAPADDESKPASEPVVRVVASSGS